MIHLAAVSSAQRLGLSAKSLSGTGAAQSLAGSVAVGAPLFRPQVHTYKLVSHCLAPGPYSGSELGLSFLS
jgi:hypothetical protein